MLFSFLKLVNQLLPGGRIIIPVGPEGRDQFLEQIDKSTDGGGMITRTKLMGVRYVPLTDKARQIRDTAAARGGAVY